AEIDVAAFDRYRVADVRLVAFPEMREHEFDKGTEAVALDAIAVPSCRKGLESLDRIALEDLPGGILEDFRCPDDAVKVRTALRGIAARRKFSRPGQLKLCNMLQVRRRGAGALPEQMDGNDRVLELAIDEVDCARVERNILGFGRDDLIVAAKLPMQA